jgi:hypothetical protein
MELPDLIGMRVLVELHQLGDLQLHTSAQRRMARLAHESVPLWKLVKPVDNSWYLTFDSRRHHSTQLSDDPWRHTHPARALWDTTRIH